ncbi:MAG: hypothetical protein RLT05_25720, partial [Bauldia litoralis]
MGTIDANSCKSGKCLAAIWPKQLVRPDYACWKIRAVSRLAIRQTPPIIRYWSFISATIEGGIKAAGREGSVSPSPDARSE